MPELPRRSFVKSTLAGSALIGIGLLVWTATAPARSRAKCKDNLKHLGDAFLDYHDNAESFPPAYSRTQPAVSWRVALLPMLNQQSLYAPYDQSQAWDSEMNRPLLNLRPATYRCPEVNDPTLSSYVAVVGAQTAWPYDEPTKIDDFESGTSMTALVVDLHDHARKWTQPKDSTFVGAIASMTKGQEHVIDSGRYTNLLLADGSVHSVSKDVDESVLRHLLSPKGGLPTTSNPEVMKRFLGPGASFCDPVDCKTLPATRLWPAPDIASSQGVSVVYCPTFALAFKE